MKLSHKEFPKKGCSIAGSCIRGSSARGPSRRLCFTGAIPYKAYFFLLKQKVAILKKVILKEVILRGFILKVILNDAISKEDVL